MPRHPLDRLEAPEWEIVGRDVERVLIDDLLSRGARAITIHGSAGAGKSRLALEWARERRDASAPVTFVSVEGLDSALALVRQLAAALDVPLRAGDADAHIERVIGSLVARGPLTLLLDGTESLEPSARAVLSSALERGTELRLVVTSRRPLELAGEEIVVLGPLPPADATALFLSLVRAARPGFTLAEEDRSTVDEIVRELDGLPLALALGAARLRVTSPSALLRLLERRFELLTTSAEGRSSSLRSALDASWMLLSDGEKLAFVELASFSAPFALSTAAHVLASESIDPVTRELRASARLDELARASLVTVIEPSEGSAPDDGPRFTMLESVRAYGRTRTGDVPTDEERRRRFADGVLERAERLVMRSRKDARALELLFGELRDIEAVLTWAEAEKDTLRTIRALASLARPRALRGPPEPFLTAAERARPELSRVTADLGIALLRGLGQSAMNAGRFEEAASAYGEAITLALSAGRRPLAALFESRLLLLAHYQGRDAAAEEASARALELLGADASPELRGRVHEAIGIVALRRGNHALARTSLETALTAARAEGLLDLEGRALGFLAWCELEAGRFSEARAGLTRASDLCASMAERRYADAFAGDVGIAFYEEGKLLEARAALTGAIAAHVRRGDRWYEADHLGHLGLVAFAAGDVVEARAMLARASRLHETGADRAQAALFRGIEAAVRAETGDPKGALEALDQARALVSETGTPVAAALSLLERAVACFGAASSDTQSDFERELANAIESSPSEMRMPARALRAALARLDARQSVRVDVPQRGASSESAVGDSHAGDPLYAARVRLDIEQRLFGGPPQRLRVGRFEVLGRLGAGAMSVVYSARDPELGRTVALKLLQPDVRSERLRREARALAKLRHPNVVTLYEVGTWNEHLFLALEHVEGATLGRWLRASPRTAEDIVRVMRAVADGLGSVHELGLVHRDVKPDNIVVDANGAPRLVDFGLVTDLEDDAAPEEATRSRSAPTADTLTRAGGAPGTPRYMAPERKAGAPASALSDQFSFAVTLEEALAGVAASSAISEAVRRGRAEVPAERFVNMAAIADALDHAFAPEPAPIWRGVLLTLGAALAAAFLVVVTLRALDPLDGHLRPADESSVDGEPASYSALGTGSTNAEARSALGRGLRALRDADRDRAMRSFERAVELDPDYGAPHLFLAIVHSHGDVNAARPHFERALSLRSSMGEEARALVTALVPCIQADPIDGAACEARLREAAEHTPSSAHLWFELARTEWNRNGSSDAVVRSFARALEADPGFQLARFSQGQALAYLGRTDEALATIDECLRLAAGATACLHDRVWIHAARGDCAEVERDARRWRASAPGDPLAYAYLASAALGRGEPLAMVEELYAQARERAPESTRPFFVGRDPVLLGIASGDFLGATDALPAFEAALGPSPDRSTRLLPARARIMIALETGEPEEAARVAEDAIARMDAWAPDPRNEDFGIARDFTPTLFDVLVETGRWSDEERDVHRAGWLGAWRARTTPAMSPFLWLAGFARTVDDEAEAVEAWAAAGELGNPPFHPLSYTDAGIGRAHLFAGAPAVALPFLERASTTCHASEFTFGLELPFEMVRAARDLGRAHETLGDVEAACAAYGRVLSRWGDARPRSVTADDARARRTALGCE